jgi:zinc protease
LSPVRRVLDNGAVVVAQETAVSPAVTFIVGFQAGSLYEDDRPGLASFLGRVIDRGSETRTADQVAEALDDRGVTLRVVTNRHVMSVSCTCLAEDFDDMLALVGDVVHQPVFPPDEVEKRRAETITSIRQDQDSPAIRAGEALQTMLYGAGHPYGRPAKGGIEAVERITREDLVAFHRARFAPGVMSLVAAGDVSASHVFDRAEEVFGGWKVLPPPLRDVPPIADADGRRFVSIPMPDKSQTDIAYGFVTINRLHPAYYAYWVMNTILGQFGLGGRLAENIRERQGMAYYAFSAFDPSLGPGPLVVRAGVDPRNVERALDAIDVEVGALGKDGPTEREMAETRQFLTGSIPRMLETNQGIATFLQSAEFFGLGLDHDRRLPELISRVTIDEVRAAAAAVLQPDRAAVAIAGAAEAASS